MVGAQNVSTPAVIQSPPGRIYSDQLVQAAPGPQQSSAIDFRQLMQAAPTDNASVSAVTSTTTTRTETYGDAHAGGNARKQAEASGDVEVRRFEEKVQTLITRTGACPLGRPWYNHAIGYLCAEGIHFIYHEDIDMAFERPGWLPQVTYANTFADPSFRVSGALCAVHPQPVDFHEPMHHVHRNFMRAIRESGSFDISSDYSVEELGCGDECLRGIERNSQQVRDSRLLRDGFNPYATRRRMFR